MRPAPIQPSFTTFAAVNSTLPGNYFGAGSITARTVPTRTVVPDSTRIALSTPLAMAGISVVTLSASSSPNHSLAFAPHPSFLDPIFHGGVGDRFSPFGPAEHA